MEMGSSSLGSTSGSSDLLNGLKFGQKIYFEDVGSVVNSSPPLAAPPASAPSSELNSSSSKKGRGVSATPRCQVEGCNVDLTGSKTYYCRHKVCGMHSKSPKVIVTGLEQRFCQQCSRFHLLAEFDQRKRSCRRRLAGHNERRRKAPPGSLLSSRYLHDSSSIHDASKLRGFWDFPYTKCPRRDVWPPSRDVNHVFLNEITSSGRVLSNLCQGSFDTSSVNVSTHMAQPYLQSLFGGTSIPCSETQAGECFAEVSDSACALSLLSTQQWDQRIRSSGFNNYMNNEIALIPQPISNVSTNTTSNLWSFKSHEDGNSDHLDFQQLHCSINGNRFLKQSEMDESAARQHMNPGQTRACGSTSYQMNWSL